MKIWILNKRSGVLTIVVSILLLGLLVAGRNMSVTVSGKHKDLPIYCVDKGEEKVMSLSFDAAWGMVDKDTEK